jgi:riboflavin synthase
LFTGIVQEVGSIISVTAEKLNVAANSLLKGVELGGSIAVNGVCLTVTKFDDKSFSVDVMPETLSRTNLGLLHPKDPVNLERPLAFNGEIGGHIVQGHIDDTGKVIQVAREGNAVLMRFETKPSLMKYIVEKGFIAVDGTSLTVTMRDATSFGVSIVGFTRQHTILSGRQVGDIVNLEADIIGKYVENLSITQRAPITRNTVTAEFLREHGFQVN